MVYVIHGYNANELFINTAKALLKHGKSRSPRGLNTLELEDAWLMLDEPQEAICTLKSRCIDMDYLKAEMEWYQKGSLDVSEIEKASKFWSKLKNPDNTVSSNYGNIVFKQSLEPVDERDGSFTRIFPRNQYQWCFEKLLKDPDTRQAIINYNQPKHKFIENKDFVCTIAQLFKQEHNHLDSTVMMRSNDLIFGLTYDLPWFTSLQQKLAGDLNLSVGKYQHYAASLHVYEKHIKMLEQIANEKI